MYLDDFGNPKKFRKIKFTTKCDYDCLSPYEAIKYDNRSFLKLLHHKLVDGNSLYALFIVTSITEPLWVRFIYLNLDININFFLSALFFSDDIVDERSQIPKEIRVIN
jgi:hypothetical protein